MLVNQCSSGRNAALPATRSSPNASSENPETPSGSTWKAESSNGVAGRRLRSAAECGAGKKISLRLANEVTRGLPQSSSDTEKRDTADPASPWGPMTNNEDASTAGTRQIDWEMPSPSPSHCSARLAQSAS